MVVFTNNRFRQLERNQFCTLEGQNKNYFKYVDHVSAVLQPQDFGDIKESYESKEFMHPAASEIADLRQHHIDVWLRHTLRAVRTDQFRIATGDPAPPLVSSG